MCVLYVTNIVLQSDHNIGYIYVVNIHLVIPLSQNKIRIAVVLLTEIKHEYSTNVRETKTQMLYSSSPMTRPHLNSTTLLRVEHKGVPAFYPRYAGLFVVCVLRYSSICFLAYLVNGYIIL